MNTAMVDILNVAISKNGREVILAHSAEVTLTCPRCGHGHLIYIGVTVNKDMLLAALWAKDEKEEVHNEQ